MSAAERALARIQERPEGACWLWPGTTNTKGYGRIWAGSDHEKTWIAAHRVIYEALVGPIPEGLTLDHLCRNRLCVNPAHLEPCTVGENVRRGGNAQKTHCSNGHDFAEHGYTTRRPDRNDSIQRHCRICTRDRDRAWRPWRYREEE